MITFKHASMSDYRSIAALHTKSWRQNYRGVFSDCFLDDEVVDDRLSVWKNRLENPLENQLVIMAEKEEDFVGFVCAFVDEHPEYGTLVDNLHVDSNFIGQRIGEQLMIRVAKFLSDNGKASMYLWVLAGNHKAIRFYERIGGKSVETINDFDIGDREITKCRYHWPDLDFILSLDR